MPGDSGPVVALAPKPNAPPALTTIILLMSIASRMVIIVISLPLEIAPRLQMRRQLYFASWTPERNRI
jgi:hypothetical protein